MENIVRKNKGEKKPQRICLCSRHHQRREQSEMLLGFK